MCSFRIRTIRRYLDWLVKGKILDRAYPYISDLERAAQLTLSTLMARIPPASEMTEAREGLPPDVVERIPNSLEPSSTGNPWKSPHSRFRNHLIWTLLYHLGIRAGELLGIRIAHLDLRAGRLTIARQADSRFDPPTSPTEHQNLGSAIGYLRANCSDRFLTIYCNTGMVGPRLASTTSCLSPIRAIPSQARA